MRIHSIGEPFGYRGDTEGILRGILKMRFEVIRSRQNQALKATKSSKIYQLAEGGAL
jgi:hypothetical protein